MRYMVIEHFRPGRAADIYRRFAAQGRMTPEGLRYVDGWVAGDLTRCFQVMECEDAALLERWMEGWRDLIDFEVVPVVTSAEAKARALAGEDSGPA